MSIGDEILAHWQNDFTPAKVINVSSLTMQCNFLNYVQFNVFSASLATTKSASMIHSLRISLITSNVSMFHCTLNVSPLKEFCAIPNWLSILKETDTAALIFLGAFVPLTIEGNIVVNGLLASCYASSDHDLAHTGMAPI